MKLQNSIFFAFVACLGVANAQPRPVERGQNLGGTQPTLPIPRPPIFIENPAIIKGLAALHDKQCKQATRHLVEGRWLVPQQDRAGIDLLIAECDTERGWHEEAAIGYEDGLERFPELVPVIAQAQARRAIAAGDIDQTKAALRRLNADSPDLVELHFVAIRWALDAQDPAEALTWLEHCKPYLYWSWEKARHARWTADAFYQKDQDLKAFQTRLTSIWGTWPKTSAGRSALRQLTHDFMDPTTPSRWSFAELIELTVGLAKSKLTTEARRLRAAIRKQFGDRSTGLTTLIRLQRRGKRWATDTLNDVDEVLTRTTDPAIADRLNLKKAQALWQNDEGEAAIALYRQVGIEAKEATVRRAALSAGGQAAEWGEMPQEARWLRNRLLYQEPPGPDRAVERWRAAWLAWQTKDYTEAERHLAALQSDHPNVHDRSRRPYYERALYWRGRIRAAQGDLPGAQRLWRFLADRAPVSYYGLLASQRLNVDAYQTVDGLPTAPPDITAFDQLSSNVRAPLTLWRLGLWKQAQAVLRHHFNIGQLDTTGVQLLSAMYLERGDYWRSHWIVQAADPLDVSPTGPGRARWLLAYPRPFRWMVRKEAQDHDLDPLLIWAIMRQESAFRTKVQSSAKALGLMQVLLPTAQAMARHLGDPAPTRTLLMTRQGSVHFGAAYLRRLLNRYNGNVALSIAAYNCGPGNVDKWLLRWDHLELDEQVESIPFGETRGYVRKVLRSYGAYRALYSSSADPGPWSLPKRQSVQPVARR